MTDNKLLSKLSENLIEILHDEEYYDVTIEVGNDSYVKIFRAHMVILSYRSSYLRRILSTNKKKNDGILTNIKLSNVSPEFFHVILRYIYGGTLSLENYDISEIVKILIAANELNLQELIPYLESYLIENKKNYLVNNFNLIYRTSHENESFSKLQKYCNDLISNEPNKIFNSLNFSSIPEKILVTIIQNNNLKMGEIQIWEHMIKWGLAQNPELPSDPTKFSKDSKEFLKKVLPYKKILPKELYKDLLDYFLDNDSKKSVPRIVEGDKEIKDIDSNIITNKHVEIILKWINRLEITDKMTTSYECKLLYRDSRDGLSGTYRFDRFCEICKNISCTLLVIKMKHSNEIIGGYNPIEWKFNDSYGVTKDSFIFSFGEDGIEDHILSYVKNETKAVYGSFFTNFGPSFGDKDLCLKKNSYNNELKVICKKNDYEKHIRDTNNSCFIKEFEVFHVVAKGISD
ncbi:carbohydrate-binding module family 13 protein [Rhizophagus clarus]|uniref:Carbohydrate-binding module family 13 protein n=1 Tax=Rhizophagus clarus TaxID=94130 RepID=A0A8H3QGR7_9GLOM|nr:carbohydrate-binding module family 13 protein [Rhizophagus clarus]